MSPRGDADATHRGDKQARRAGRYPDGTTANGGPNAGAPPGPVAADELRHERGGADRAQQQQHREKHDRCAGRTASARAATRAAVRRAAMARRPATRAADGADGDRRHVMARRTCSRCRRRSGCSADCAESGSSLRRMFLMWASIARSNDSTSVPRTASSSCARVKTRPGCRASVASSWNSVGVRSIGVPARADRHAARTSMRQIGAAEDVVAAGAGARRAAAPRARARPARAG